MNCRDNYILSVELNAKNKEINHIFVITQKFCERCNYINLVALS
jgi:hypothetical protein